MEKETKDLQKRLKNAKIVLAALGNEIRQDILSNLLLVPRKDFGSANSKRAVNFQGLLYRIISKSFIMQK